MNLIVILKTSLTLQSLIYRLRYSQQRILIDYLNLFKILLIVTPHTRCRLKLLKLERIKDYLLMEEEFIRNQERLKPQEEKHEVSQSCSVFVLSTVFYHSFCQCLPLIWFKIMD